MVSGKEEEVEDDGEFSVVAVINSCCKNVAFRKCCFSYFWENRDADDDRDDEKGGKR